MKLCNDERDDEILRFDSEYGPNFATWWLTLVQEIP